jgi:ABC-type transport system involved in multi-copper enzyme maturation permease subunit
MPLHDAHYQHWDGRHTGIWGRRWVIARNGLEACLNNKGLRTLLLTCWSVGLIMAGILFLVGQLLVPDSIVAQWVTKMNPNLQSFAGMLTFWLKDHPAISVGTSQNVLFYYYCVYSMPLSIFALGFCLPALITRDLASNAIVIYSSKAVTRGDYLLGKFCTAFGVLTMTWLGPVCGAWFMGNLLAPDWKFFWHARIALFHALVFGLSSMVILCLLALGVSAVSSREKSTPALWFTWWVLGLAIQPIALHTLKWLRHLSFGYDLRQIGLAIFNLGQNLKTAQDGIPIFGQMLQGVRPETRAAINDPTLGGALAALALMLLLAALIIKKRVAPE